VFQVVNLITKQAHVVVLTATILGIAAALMVSQTNGPIASFILVILR